MSANITRKKFLLHNVYFILKAEEHFVLILKVFAYCTLLVSKIVCGHEKYR